MNRRTFSKLSSLAAIGALTKTAAAQTIEPPAIHPAPHELVLEDAHLLAAFDPASGALTRLERKSTGWQIQRRPALGVSFRLLAPLPHQRYNFIYGQKQRASRAEKISPRELRFEWIDFRSEHGGVLPIIFRATVTLANGALTFAGTLVNNSSLVLETLDYPYLGDLTPPAPADRLTSEHVNYGNLESHEIHPEFRGEKGYYGVDFPIQTRPSKQSLFCLIQSPTQGLYVEMHDPTQPYLLEYTFEQHPGDLDSIRNQVPPQDEISGIPVHLEFRTCHFLFAHPHSTRQLAPVVLQPYNGDWHAGVDLYKQWRATWFHKPRTAAWVMDVHAWQQLQIDSPEEDRRVRYSDLAAYIDQCAASGIRAIQLVGWNIGGQDRDDPSQDTDPALGTWRELHDAIAYGKSKGVAIILFGKLNYADLSTQRYKDDLYRYAATDPFGVPYQQEGYSYLTPTQLAGINNRRRAIMDTADPAWRDIATREFEKVVALGAPGWLFDEICWHGPADYSFSNSHGYNPPGYLYSGDLPLARQMRAAADHADPDFVFAGEAPGDWLMQLYPVSYFRIEGHSRAFCRYIDPQTPLMIAVTGFDDREMLNETLLNRYIVSYEPYNFKGRLTDFPLTLAYGQKIDALRHRYREHLWDAEFRDTVGATVTANGSYRHSVFISKSGRRAVVLVNNQPAKPITATVHLANAGPLSLATPEQPEAIPTSGTLTVPARSAAVLMEL